MNSKWMNHPQQARERAVYDYLQSLESGDLDGIIDVLQRATYDASLDQMVMDAHHAYFQDEHIQERTLAGMDTHEIAALEPAPLPSHGMGQQQSRKTRHASPWLQALVAVLLLALMVSSFLTLLALRRSGTSGLSTPTVTPPCQSYPFKQFDAQHHATTASSMNALGAVTVISANDAWAVGSSSNVPTAQPHTSTFIEHWDGRSWQIVSSPDGNGSLVAVAAVSTSDVWAVGSSTYGTIPQGSAIGSPLRTLIEHWDGKRWRVVPSPNSPDGNGSLKALAAISANNIWAAGSLADRKLGLSRPFLEHWDGTGWRIVPFEGSSVPPGESYGTVGFFTSMSALTANDVWVVGMGRNANEQRVHGLIEHWNGSQWASLYAPPTSSLLEGVSALSTHDLWVSGNDANGYPLIAHWDGQLWNRMTLPASLAKQATDLPGLSALSSGDIWAVGSVRGNDQINHLLILHWNGKTWHQVSLPALQGSSTLPNSSAGGIAVYGGRRVWIVGSERDSEGGYSSALILGQFTCP